jgi:hypothetical protein
MKSLPSASDVSTLVVTAMVQLGVHLIQPMQLTRRYHTLKVRIERHFGYHNHEDWQTHLERHTVIYFFSLFAHLAVPFLFFFSTLVLTNGPMRESLPYYTLPQDRINNLLWFNGIMTINVAVQIAVFAMIIQRHLKVYSLETIYLQHFCNEKCFFTM